VYINNICFLKHFRKQVLLIYIVHLLDKYNMILQNAQYLHQENAGISYVIMGYDYFVVYIHVGFVYLEVWLTLNE
jgi:hypothetical protein